MQEHLELNLGIASFCSLYRDRNAEDARKQNSNMQRYVLLLQTYKEGGFKQSKQLEIPAQPHHSISVSHNVAIHNHTTRDT